MNIDVLCTWYKLFSLSFSYFFTAEFARDSTSPTMCTALRRSDELCSKIVLLCYAPMLLKLCMLQDSFTLCLLFMSTHGLLGKLRRSKTSPFSEVIRLVLDSCSITHTHWKRHLSQTLIGKVTILAMPLTALYYSSVCSYASTVLFYSSIIHQGLTQGKDSMNTL